MPFIQTIVRTDAAALAVFTDHKKRKIVLVRATLVCLLFNRKDRSLGNQFKRVLCAF